VLTELLCILAVLMPISWLWYFSLAFLFCCSAKDQPQGLLHTSTLPLRSELHPQALVMIVYYSFTK
jgi:hypothetical protein